MALIDRIAEYVGLPAAAIDRGADRPVRIEADREGAVRIAFWDEGTLGKPEPTVAQVAAWAADATPTAGELRAYAAARRYAAEVAGVTATIGGQRVIVSTARDMRDGMRDTMLGIVVGLRKDGAVLKIFADGVPRAASNAEAEAAIGAAYAHVQAAFDVEGPLVAGIDASPPTVTTLAQIDAAAWPAGPAA